MDDFAIDFDEEYVIVRMNGGKQKCPDELKIIKTEQLKMSEVIKQAEKKFNKSPGTPASKLYNKDGVHLFEADFKYINNGEVVYLAMRGEDFNYCAILDDYELIRTLGEGGFGEVKLGRHRENKSEVAIKFMDIGQELSSASAIAGIYKEADALKALSHKHIIKLYHGFIDGKRFVMIMEAAHGGQLLDFLKTNKAFPEPIAREIIIQVVQAMLYCHSRGVVHRDLKLENVLFKSTLKDDYFVKVVDFGIAGVGQEKVDSGTLAYMAPECLDRAGATTSPAIDVWAIGVMFYTMVYGELPFFANEEKTLIKRIINDPIRFKNSYPITHLGKEMLKAMLDKDPTKRIELIDFVQSEYNIIDEDEFEQLYEKTKVEFEENKARIKKQEEEKEQEQIIQKFNNMKQDDNNKLRREYHPPPLHNSPRSGKKDGKVVKKKKKS